MVSTYMKTGKTVSIPDFCLLFNIDGETVVPEGVPGGTRATLG